MRRQIARLMGGRLQIVLIASFSLIAALTVGLNALGSSRVINDYLARAEDERVARDMDLAQAFYQLKLDEIAAISHRLVLDQWVNDNLGLAETGDAQAIGIIDQQITNKITVLALGGTHVILVLDENGNILAGRTLTDDGGLSPVITQGSWAGLPILENTLATGQETTATEVIPARYLAKVGLADQAATRLIETARAAPYPFDQREGTAGLALTGVAPLKDRAGQVRGAVLAIYLFNKDYTLVDRIKEVAGVDTVTIFFGDLRVSTNVMTEAGARAVGTRVSQAVNDVVLKGGSDYVGRAFVVNEWFITQYVPLKDHLQQVVGMLYVGASVTAFENLVRNFNAQVAVIALVCILLAGIVAVPITRLISRPIQELVSANRRLAEGDMSVRVEPYGSGELAELGESFNAMVETLHQTQQELLHKERLVSMGQLAAGVAHEINNPLGSILLYADVMRKETSQADPQYEDLSMIIDEGTRCKRIVADLLNFARQQQIVVQETDLHELIDEVLERVSRQPSFEGVQIVRNYDPDLPVITADRDQLQQVFVNLLNNAAEAIEQAGTITLTTHKMGADWVQIEISDTGCGIAPEHLGRLFTPFFTTKQVGEGTGLGLSIVYGIIKMHRGQIQVSSTLNAGTTFTITLPVRLPAGISTPLGAAEVIG
jgi:two-component system NtrC family sensor kinase